MEKIIKGITIKDLFKQSKEQKNVPDINILRGCLIDKRGPNAEKILEKERNRELLNSQNPVLS